MKFNKKGNGIIILIAVIIGLMILTIVGVFIFIGGKDGKIISGNKNVTSGYPIITIYLGTMDSKTREISPSQYYILDDKNNLLAQGTSTNSYISINVNVNRSIIVYCYNQDHYLSIVYKNLTDYELSKNETKIECKMDRIGKLKINDIQGDIQNIDNVIILNLSSEGGIYKRLSICFSKTAGIISVKMDNNYLSCPDNVWINYSSYDSEKKKYAWLPKGEFMCGSRLEKCNQVIGNSCQTPFITIPSRFTRDFDSCKYFGYDLDQKSSQSIVINVKTSSVKNNLDALNIVFFDEDLRYINNSLMFVSDNDGHDIGSIDQSLKIKFKNE